MKQSRLLVHMTLMAVPVACALLASGCTVRESTAMRALHGAGYKQVHLGGYSWFGCSDEDDFSRKFTAVGADGKPVKGVVCSGVMKGTTVRTW